MAELPPAPDVQRSRYQHHDHQPACSRRQRDRPAPPSSLHWRPGRPLGDDTDTDVGSSAGAARSGGYRWSGDRGSGKLAQLYMETKTDMLSIIEEDLEIKIEIQSIKEQFLNLLHFYDNYEASGDKWSGNVAAVPGRKLAERDRGSYRLHLRRSLAVPCPGEPELQDLNFNIASPENGLHRARPALYTTAPTENSKPSSMSTGAHAMGGESSIDVDADTSVEVKAGPAKDFKQKQKGSKFPTTDSNVDDQEESKALKDISQTPKCSDCSCKPLSNSALTGPFNSTLNATPPGNITSDMPKPSGHTHDTTALTTSQVTNALAHARPRLRERPSPIGMDDIHCHAPVAARLATTSGLVTPTQLAQATTSTGSCSSLDESTPIVTMKYRRRTRRAGVTSGETPDDSTPRSYKASSNTMEDTPVTIKILSRVEFLDLNADGSGFSRGDDVRDGNEMKDLNSTSSTSSILKEGRLVAGVSVAGLRQPGIGLSMTALLGLIPWKVDDDSISSSVDGTRASQASAGALPLPSACGDSTRASSDSASLSSFRISSMTTESSYKESDASSIPISEPSTQLPRPAVKKRHPAVRHIDSKTVSTDSLPSELWAPVNSPNTTTDDLSLSSRPTSTDSSKAPTSVSSRDNIKTETMSQSGNEVMRPPCLGGELLLRPQQQQQQGAASTTACQTDLPASAPDADTDDTKARACSASGVRQLPPPADSSESDLAVIVTASETDSESGANEVNHVDKCTPRTSPQDQCTPCATPQDQCTPCASSQDQCTSCTSLHDQCTPYRSPQGKHTSYRTPQDQHRPYRSPQAASGLEKFTFLRRLRSLRKRFRANSRESKSSGSSSKNRSKEPK